MLVEIRGYPHYLIMGLFKAGSLVLEFVETEGVSEFSKVSFLMVCKGSSWPVRLIPFREKSHLEKRGTNAHTDGHILDVDRGSTGR